MSQKPVEKKFENVIAEIEQYENNPDKIGIVALNGFITFFEKKLRNYNSYIRHNLFPRNLDRIINFYNNNLIYFFQNLVEYYGNAHPNKRKRTEEILVILNETMNAIAQLIQIRTEFLSRYNENASEEDTKAFNNALNKYKKSIEPKQTAETQTKNGEFPSSGGVFPYLQFYDEFKNLNKSTRSIDNSLKVIGNEFTRFVNFEERKTPNIAPVNTQYTYTGTNYNGKYNYIGNR